MASLHYEQFSEINFQGKKTLLIDQCDRIIRKNISAGYTLTLRQLYYQLVSINFIPNNQRSYDRLGEAVSDGRMAGLLPWNGIEDRTRSIDSPLTFDGLPDLLRHAENWYALDRWQGQSMRLEVWIEKDALSGIFEGVCKELQIPLFACKGYVSASEMMEAAKRINNRAGREAQSTVILHFGDHDPSGIDMTNDIIRRLRTLTRGGKVMVIRCGLNRDQILQYNCPPNPTKISDSRADKYMEEFGRESWELDALASVDPEILINIVRDFYDRFTGEDEMKSFIDLDLWNEIEAAEERDREILADLIQRFEDESDPE